MSKRITADDFIPLVAVLAPLERVKLVLLIVQDTSIDEAAVYPAMPPQRDEFSCDAESLEWEREGWEDFD